jgi:hypothetical protein
MSADQRVVQAREFLDAIMPYPVASRPVSVLQREDAELRRMIRALLEYVTESVSLTDGQLVTLGQALADAVAWREHGSECTGCEASPADRCDDHLADDEKIAGYLELAAALGIEVSS